MLHVNHLIGFGSFEDAAAAAPVTSLAFHDDAYSITSSATMPAGSIAGDLIIFADSATNSASSAPTLVTPTDFTPWINLTQGLARYAVSYKIADGTETTITGMDGNENDDKILAVFRPDAPITTITASTPGGQVTTGNPSAQNINADGDGTLPLIAFGFYYSGAYNVINPRTMSPAATGELFNAGNGTDWHYVKYQLQNAALADVSVDMDDEGTNNILASGFLWAA
jgi:hypothetical protein